MLASFVDLSLLKTINLLNLWLHVTPRSLRRLRASQGLIPGPWYVPDKLRTSARALGSVNAPPPLDHRQSGVGWSRATVDCFEDRDPSTPRKEFMAVVEDFGSLLNVATAQQPQARKEFMAGKFRAESIQMLINHWRWLQANGYKQQAASCKLQALDLTRKNYKVIGVYRRKNYESKRSKKNS